MRSQPPDLGGLCLPMESFFDGCSESARERKLLGFLRNSSRLLPNDQVMGVGAAV